MLTTNPREISYLALLQKQKTLDEFLKIWKESSSPSALDAKLAKEIAFGTMRRQKSLEYLAKLLWPQLQVEPKVLILLFTALYQYYFMDKIPLYAIVNETVNIAKKHCRAKIAAYFNAILRHLPSIKPPLPQDNLAIFYSYPEYFIDLLVAEYGREKAKELLDTQNHFFTPMVRERAPNPFQVFALKEDEEVTKYSNSSLYYIQNATPVNLIKELSSALPLQPQTILDLCASPGGKTILAHDLFPKSALFANDVSPKKLQTLASNLKKYSIAAELSQNATTYPTKFDLIIVDAPCSNSGTLHKRAEARWRINEEELKKLQAKQLALLEQSAALLNTSGVIWYMTCSILQKENEEVCSRFGLKILKSVKILPNNEGWDGGFGAALSVGS